MVARKVGAGRSRGRSKVVFHLSSATLVPFRFVSSLWHFPADLRGLGRAIADEIEGCRNGCSVRAADEGVGLRRTGGDVRDEMDWR